MAEFKRQSKLRLFTNRFGWYDSLFIPVGTLIMLSVAVFLASFWEWGNRSAIEDRVGFWSMVVIHGWGNRVITLSTALIRICMATQVLICCYMVASMALEYDQVRKKDKDKMSIYQRGTDGPSSILLMFLKARWSSQKRNTTGVLLLTFMVLTGFASQLFSTTLLSDFASEVLPGTLVSRQIPYGSQNPDEYTAFTSKPREYPLFAENPVERTFIDGHGSSPGFFDSGPVRRAFVPLPASERVALASYDGPVNVLEMQYLCFPIPLNYTWNRTKMTGTFAQPSARVLQFIAERGGPFNLTSTTDWSKIEFTCEPNMGDLSVCEGQSIESWSMIFGEADNPTATTLPDEYQGEWVTSTFVNIDNLYPNIRMKYTVCAKHVKSGDGHARIESKSNLTEPVLLNGTKDSVREAKWDTSAIQRVLGVQSMERRSSQQRGIFQLLSHKVIEY